MNNNDKLFNRVFTFMIIIMKKFLIISMSIFAFLITKPSIGQDIKDFKQWKPLKEGKVVYFFIDKPFDEIFANEVKDLLNNDNNIWEVITRNTNDKLYIQFKGSLDITVDYINNILVNKELEISNSSILTDETVNIDNSIPKQPDPEPSLKHFDEKKYGQYIDPEKITINQRQKENELERDEEKIILEKKKREELEQKLNQ